MVPIARVDQQQSETGLYSETLFDLSNLPANIRAQGLELGRSFVQPVYWGKRSLDYLWHGIGAYLNNNSDIRYLLGAVSISNDFNKEAKASLVRFYEQYFGDDANMVKATRPFTFTEQEGLAVSGNDYSEEFKALKAKLKQEGASVPTLYKQYSELCEEGGTRFCAFNVDPDFCDCIDGFVVVDMNKLKANKRERYMGTKQN